MHDISCMSNRCQLNNHRLKAGGFKIRTESRVKDPSLMFGSEVVVRIWLKMMNQIFPNHLFGHQQSHRNNPSPKNVGPSDTFSESQAASSLVISFCVSP